MQEVNPDFFSFYPGTEEGRGNEPETRSPRHSDILHPLHLRLSHSSLPANKVQNFIFILL